MGKYIENVAFYMGSINPSKKEIFKTNNTIFQNKDQHYLVEVDDANLLKSIKSILENTENAPTIEKIRVTFSIFGVSNLRVYCTTQEQLDPDKFSFDEEGDCYAEIYKSIKSVLKEKKLIEVDSSNLFLDNVKPLHRYLYHQHLAVKIANEFSEEPEVTWSVYRYGNNEISEDNLDLDSLLLERHVLYYVFSRCYMEAIGGKNADLKVVQSILNKNRCLIAEHEMLLHELDSKHFEKFENYLPVHRIDKSKETYNKLENDLEHLSEQLEDERRYKESKFMELIFLGLAVIGLVSIITGILALLPGKSEVCDTNTSDFILSPAYSVTVGHVGDGLIMVAALIFIIGFVFIGIKFWKYKNLK